MKVLFAIVTSSIVVLLGYYVIFADKSEDKKDAASLNEAMIATYQDSRGGIVFDYKTGIKGYVTEERVPVATDEEPIKTIVLIPSEDATEAPPLGGEASPVISVALYTNSENLSPLAWAEKNPQYSTINLLQGERGDITVAGASAIRYMADGLYVSENVVIAHNGMIYVITGQFIDEQTDIRRDFSPLIESIRFL